MNCSKIVNCYWGTWAAYRDGNGKFQASDIHPQLCNRLSYCFFGIDESGRIKHIDENIDINQGYISRATHMKAENPHLKVIAVVGGWNHSTNFSSMAASSTKRSNFISSTLAFIRNHNFDGLDLDWEYPNKDGSNANDKTNFVKILREMKSAFQVYGYELSIAVGASEYVAAGSYNIPEISKYVDFINLMTYDFNSYRRGCLGFNAPLPDVKRAVNYWKKNGAPSEKLVLGIPSYGQSFTMHNGLNRKPGDSCLRSGNPGPYSKENGTLGYNEICPNRWKTVFDQESASPYAYNGDQWVSFDSPESVKIKMNLVRDYRLGGAMMWSIETDDFRGISGKKYPILKAIIDSL